MFPCHCRWTHTVSETLRPMSFDSLKIPLSLSVIELIPPALHMLTVRGEREEKRIGWSNVFSSGLMIDLIDFIENLILVKDNPVLVHHFVSIWLWNGAITPLTLIWLTYRPVLKTSTFNSITLVYLTRNLNSDHEKYVNLKDCMYT